MEIGKKKIRLKEREYKHFLFTLLNFNEKKVGWVKKITFFLV